MIRIADVAHAIERYGERYTRRIFTAREEEYCRRDPHLASQRFAVRFAAKEATTKLLRVETDTLLWRSIEVRRHAEGWCDVVLHGDVSALADTQGVTGLALSMSHEGEYAMATVIAHRAVIGQD